MAKLKGLENTLTAQELLIKLQSMSKSQRETTYMGVQCPEIENVGHPIVSMDLAEDESRGTTAAVLHFSIASNAKCNCKSHWPKAVIIES